MQRKWLETALLLVRRCRLPWQLFPYFRHALRCSWQVGASAMASTSSVSGVEAKMNVSWRIARLSVICTGFISLLLLYGCTYFTMRSQLQQLRADVDQLKAVHSLSVKPAEEAGLLGDDANGDQLLRRRSKRHDDAFNQSSARNDTSDNADVDDAGSGELADNQYRGIWMGTYSRVPVSYSEISHYVFHTSN